MKKMKKNATRKNKEKNMVTMFDERKYADLIRLLNKHLPTSRKTLAELLNEEKPALTGRDGSMHRILKEELIMIADMLDEDEKKQLKIPIYIELTPKYHGMARIQGKLSCKVVRKIIGKEEQTHAYDPEYEDDRHSEREQCMFIHRADLRKLRRILRTATQYVFMP